MKQAGTGPWSNSGISLPYVHNPVLMNPLTGIKLLHTLIWLFFVAIIAYIGYGALTGHITHCTWLGMALVCMEGAVLLLCKGTCPLTHWARRYSTSERHNFDIYLPEMLAKYNQRIFTALFVVGVIGVLWRWAMQQL